MNNIYGKRYILISFLLIFAVAGVLLSCPDSFAAEATSKGRKIWDNVMLFVNFGILVFLFIKFAKNPLMDFLNGEGKKISKDINEIEDQVQKARGLMDSEAAKLEGIDRRVKEIREQILEIGKREKDKIIEKAEAAARQMIDDAKKEADYRLEKAKKRFSEEMLETAVSIAVEELKKGFTQEDNETIIDRFSEELIGGEIHFA